MTGRLLLVEDDRGLVELLTWHLEREGFDVVDTPDGEEALRLAKEVPPELVLLDWMIEGVPGIEVCRRLRRTPEIAHVPIIIITGRVEEGDRILGLKTGADDYVAKPFSPRELVARIGAVLRRAQPDLSSERLHFADLEMDLARYRVRRHGRNVALGPTEFRLLRYFMEHPRRAFTRERLLDALWERDKGIELRTIDVHVRRLRQALAAPGGPELIRTVRQVGYALDDEAG